MMNIYGVNKYIKQRPPFQMIEKVLDVIPNESAVGVKAVAINEPWFQGHFPDSPIMPGVLIIESCAQLCSITMETHEASDNKLYVLLKVDNFKFLKPIIPGDLMTVSVKKKSGSGPIITYDAVVTVDGEIRSKGSLSFTAIPDVKDN